MSRLIGSAALLKAACLLLFERAPRGMGGSLHAGSTLSAGLRPFMGVAHVHPRRCFRGEPLIAVQSAPSRAFCARIYPSRLCNTDECLCPRALPAATFIMCKLYLCSLPPASNRQDFVAAFLHSSILGRVRREVFLFLFFASLTSIYCIQPTSESAISVKPDCQHPASRSICKAHNLSCLSD